MFQKMSRSLMTMLATFCRAIEKVNEQKSFYKHLCNFSLHSVNIWQPEKDFTQVFFPPVHFWFVGRHWPLYSLKCPRTFIVIFLTPLLCGFFFTLLWNESLHPPSSTKTNVIAAPEHMVEPKKRVILQECICMHHLSHRPQWRI